MFQIEEYQKRLDSLGDSQKFWESVAEELEWSEKWTEILEWKYPFANWFKNGKTNIISNAVDRHLKTQPDKIALIWVSEDLQEKKFSYSDVNKQVSKLANVLKDLGIQKGDKVVLYLPRIPELIFSMLACAKIGAVHSVVYSGFSSEALKTRINDAEAKIVITADGYKYKGKTIECKKTVDGATEDIDIKRIVVKRLGNDISWTDKDLWFSELMDQAVEECATVQVDSHDPLYILYTSGTTGTPKGILHTHGGYQVGTYLTLKTLFDIQPDDIYWCVGDPGWVTGHSYVTYGPMINGVTQVIFEGAPDFPHTGVWWELIQKYKVTKFYATPTAIRSLMRFGDDIPHKYDLSSLKILGTVGEPINPAAWEWYHEHIGGGRCPIIDTWWQTETGMHMIASTPISKPKPGSGYKPFLTVEADVVDETGKSVKPNQEGFLVIKTQWPAMFATVYKNEELYKKNYWEKIPGVYFTGDTCKIDEDGYFWIIGRNDDVLKVSGYRLGTAEVESAVNSTGEVAESAAIGKPHDIKGHSIKVFVILKQGIEESEEVVKIIRQTVKEKLGPIAVPDDIEFVKTLPKTRSGKIMRRLLRAKELGQDLGDTSTLED